MATRASTRKRALDQGESDASEFDAAPTSSSTRRSKRLCDRDASSSASPLTSLSPSPGPRSSTRKIVIRGHTLKPTVVFDTFWRWLAERQSIHEKRRQGMPAPWTEDPILQEYKFCNAYRVLDKNSQYVIKQIIEKGPQSREELLFRILLFNCFNKIETWELLEDAFGDKLTYKHFDLAAYDKVLSAAINRGITLFTGAYMKIGHRIDYDANHMRHLQLLQILMRDLPSVLEEKQYAVEVYEEIGAYQGMGPFNTYQLMLSLSCSCLLNFSANDFVVAGLGASSGLAKMFGASLARAKKVEPEIELDILRWLTETQREHFARLGIKFAYLRGTDGREIELSLPDMEHAACEVDKYARRAHPSIQGIGGRTQLRSQYVPAPAGSLPTTMSVVLPKAWSHPARLKSRIRPGPIVIDKRYCISYLSAERPAQKKEHGETLEYLVYWVGYDKPTWEPRSLILEDAPDLVEEWEAKKKAKKTARRS